MANELYVRLKFAREVKPKVIDVNCRFLILPSQEILKISRPKLL